MKPLKLLLVREPTRFVTNGEAYTPGILYADGLRFSFTCEDEDRMLEKAGVDRKVYGRTAIPRGRYRVEVSWSHRFGKLLPAVLDVPGFSGIRFHGGNRAEDSLGCILVGKVRTATGIAQCADSVQRLIALIQDADDKGSEVWLEVQ